MSANYKFAFVRQVAPAPVRAVGAVGAVGAAPVGATRTPVTSANRFSVNRLIHVKNSGGCRSCG